MIVNPKYAARIVLVPNRDVQQQHLVSQLGELKEAQAVIAPPTYIFSSWVEKLAVQIRMLEGREVPVSLTAWSGLLAWRSGIRSKFDDSSGYPDITAAKLARDADRLIRQWIPDEETPWLASPFFDIRKDAQRYLESRHLFSSEDWIQDLTGSLENKERGQVRLPEEISLVGFVEITLQESALLGALESHGTKITRHSTERPAHVRVGSFPAPEDEWQAAKNQRCYEDVTHLLPRRPDLYD